MVTQNASTGSGRNLLISGGMLQLTAFDLRSNPLNICNDKSITALVPTIEPDNDMQLFYASRDENYGLDWELQNPEEKLEIINGSVFKDCFYPEVNSNNKQVYRNKDTGKGGSAKCHLFFCKIRYGIINYCRRKFSKKTSSYTSYKAPKTKPARIYKSYQQRQTAMALEDLCEDRKQKLADIEARYNGLNTNWMKDLTEAEMNYYIYHITQLNWTNIDKYLNLPPAKLTNVSLDLTAASTTDVKLIFRKNKAVMPSYDVDGKIGFPNVPKGEKATLLGLRFVNGQPAMALKEITLNGNTTELELEFKNYGLSALKQLLEKL